MNDKDLFNAMIQNAEAAKQNTLTRIARQTRRGNTAAVANLNLLLAMWETKIVKWSTLLKEVA